MRMRSQEVALTSSITASPCHSRVDAIMRRLSALPHPCRCPDWLAADPSVGEPIIQLACRDALFLKARRWPGIDLGFRAVRWLGATALEKQPLGTGHAHESLVLGNGLAFERKQFLQMPRHAPAPDLQDLLRAV